MSLYALRAPAPPPSPRPFLPQHGGCSWSNPVHPGRGRCFEPHTGQGLKGKAIIPGHPQLLLLHSPPRMQEFSGLTGYQHSRSSPSHQRRQLGAKGPGRHVLHLQKADGLGPIPTQVQDVAPLRALSQVGNNRILGAIESSCL